MLYSVVVAGVLVMVAVQRERVQSGLGRPVRHVWLLCAMLTLLLTSSVLWPALEAGGDAVVAVGADGEDRLSEERVWMQWLARIEGSAAAGPLRSLDVVLVVGWVVSSMLCVVVLAGSLQRLNRRRAGWRRSWVQGEPVLLTDGMGPVVVGIVHGEIALPEWVLGLEPGEQSLIIEHERQHRIAGDPLLMFAGLSTAALLPWNPFVWIMVRRLRRGMEIDCDRRVLREVESPAVYAKLLVEIGSRALHGPHPVMALTDSLSDLEHRVARIVDPLRHGRWSAGARTVLGGALLLAACFAPRPAVRHASSDASTIVPQVTDRSASADTVRTEGTVDGAGRRAPGSGVRVGALQGGGRGGSPIDSVRSGAAVGARGRTRPPTRDTLAATGLRR